MTKNIYTQFGFKDEQDYKDNLYAGAYKAILSEVDGKKTNRIELVTTCRALIKKDKRISTLAAVMLSKWFEDYYTGAVKLNKKRTSLFDKLFKRGKK